MGRCAPSILAWLAVEPVVADGPVGARRALIELNEGELPGLVGAARAAKEGVRRQEKVREDNTWQEKGKRR